MPKRKPTPTYDRREVGPLAGMRVRKKLILLHTLFTVVLAGLLVVALQPVLSRIVSEAEFATAATALERLRATGGSPDLVTSSGPAQVSVRVGTPAELDLPPGLALNQASPTRVRSRNGATAAAWQLAGENPRVAIAEVTIPASRAAVASLYGLVLIVLLGVYGLIALGLEVFVLPRALYRPIRVMLAADAATRAGDDEHEVIPEQQIPEDEFGEIMRSHNETVRALRHNERELAAALAELERVAADLKTKNDLLEAARRNLADADRLASLGMMSAGIAHEINTPLTVASGLAERLAAGDTLTSAEAALLQRVIGRLERLGESLLDYARVRDPKTSQVRISAVIDEAFALVRLDRKAPGLTLDNASDPDLTVEADGDRLLQVLVNLVRNSADAIHRAQGTVRVESEAVEREGVRWVGIRVLDDGPGIDPAMIPTLFEPFVSSRLDAKGTGLGLAVAQGIIQEHGGTLVARNRERARGALFEIYLPVSQPAGDTLAK